MDAIPALSLSFIAAFPGLMLYCAVYDVFCRRNNVISTVPRDPKSVEALAVIILGSIAVHLVAIIVSQAITWPCWFDLCSMVPPTSSRAGEAVLIDMAAGGTASSNEISVLAISTLLLGIAAYVVADKVMIHRARTERLPYWLYRWTGSVAISADKLNSIMIAYVLTNIEVDKKYILYAGIVDDLAVDEHFNIKRLILVECSRFLMDMSKSGHESMETALSDIPKIVIDMSIIANVSFERIDIEDEA